MAEITIDQTGLEGLIVNYAKSYYTGYAEVSDEEFDRLVDELREKYPDSELLTKPGWGYTPAKKTPHLFNLTIGGLRKVHSVSELPHILTSESVRLSPKLDGLSVVRYFVNGKCIRSVTRGNGTLGKDVTSHMEKISPLQCNALCPDSSPFTGAIRGEVILDKETFSTIYDTGEDSCNARNVASGLLNRDSLSDEDAQNLSFVAYKVEYSQNYEFKSIDEVDEFLTKISRNVFHQTFTSLSEDKGLTDETFKRIYNYFCKSEYGLDGIVLTVYQGQSEGRLNYEEVAYKFESVSKTVTVKEVTWNTTRTGRVVPRIWFDPIELSGVSVRKCTGHNAKYILDNCIGPGAQIKVTRSGEVIPYCVEVVEKAIPQMPEITGTYWDGADLKVDCEENYLPYRFFTVIGEEEGAGPALYQSILDALALNNEEDLVNFGNMTYEECVERLPRTISGDKTLELAQRVIKKIKCDPVGPITFLVACNIPGISWKTFSKILKEYPDFLKDIKEDWVSYSDVLDKVSGVGYSTRETILKYAQRVRKLMSIVNLKEVETPQTNEEVRYVAITGKLSVKRSEFEELLLSKGFEVSSINKETFCLITDNPFSGSSKNQKADKLGIRKMTEKEFRSLYLN